MSLISNIAFPTSDVRLDNFPKNYSDPYLLALSRTYMLKLADPKSMAHFFLLADTCKKLDKTFRMYITSVKMHHEVMDYKMAVEVIEGKQLPFAICYALRALFSLSYKVCYCCLG